MSTGYLPKPGANYEKTPAEIARHNAACPRTGSYFARIFKFTNFGTHNEFYQKKPITPNKFEMSMEFVDPRIPPFVFREDKGLQPWTCKVGSSFSTGSTSNLYSYIKKIFRSDPNIMAQVEAGTFKIASLLNQLVQVDIEYKLSDKQVAYPKVTGIGAPMEMPSQDLSPYRICQLYNPFVIFLINDFIIQDPEAISAFKKLYKYEHKAIQESFEFIKSGLRIEDYMDKPEVPNQYNYQAQAPQGFVPPPPPVQQAPVQKQWNPPAQPGSVQGYNVQNPPWMQPQFGQPVQDPNDPGDDLPF